MNTSETKSDFTSETSINDEAGVPVETEENSHRSEIKSKPQSTDKPKEIGGRDGPDPTRFGDWENKGRCVDF